MKKQAKDESQSERFTQAARELGCDESEEPFDAALKVIAKHKPQAEMKARKSLKRRRHCRDDRFRAHTIVRRAFNAG
jgi:hypothetical protein